MAFKLNGSTAGTETKMYLFQKVNTASGLKEFVYVSADTPATVAVSGYITKADSADSEIAFNMLEVGDLIWHYQVASITDTDSIQTDMEGGITDVSLHVVVTKSATLIDLSEDLLTATVTYTA